ncbi:MAG: BlaI/MecI/CopY family transcriptional regulator [Lachnospiraceae bacterium]|nr:BlaI/MecI/CopY family transcriptional regulator [Lachnospiraceae bacterium]
MDKFGLGLVESRFAELIWENAPIGSRELSKICEKELSWKRPTTYNVLRKLCEKGLFENDNGTVRVRISRKEYQAMRGEQFVTENYDGSLPAFIAAFTSRRRLSEEEALEIQRLIDESRRRD